MPAVDENATTRCASCGASVPMVANFCPACGSRVAADGERGATDDGTAAFDAIRVGDEDGIPMVVVTRGANAGSRFALSGPTTRVGRHPDSDIFLDDVTVSRRHCELRLTASGVVAADVGSLNGTYVEGERIAEAVLREGDELQVGKFKLLFVREAVDGDG